MDSLKENFDLVQTLAAAAMASEKVGSSHQLLVPPNYSHKDISELVEKAAPAPFRKRGTVQLGNIASLLAYCADQNGADTERAADFGYLFADPETRSITAVFNDHRGPTPGWRDHRASFKAEYTPEFDNWLRHNKQPKSQTEFAEFIEDNFADLQGEDATNLLNVATTIQATTGINFASARRLQDGQTQLTYNEVIDAKAGADGALKIPQTFALGLRIFKNGGGYKLTARLKYRLAGGGVKFWYELERPERAVEDAFQGYIDELTEKSGYTVLIGKP
ncbi:DUF2303 family protein [Polaromonas jejuensis]|uniref:DUF2303 family protein n=1 Tax=Polaromonas jejuensis TaxID=457502 RepID=A0ABW0QIM6_9BURK|nr:DUF2303 family protein [Polaromonas jejuensis]